MLEKEKENYERLSNMAVNFYEQIEANEKQNPDSKIDTELFAAHTKTLSGLLAANNEHYT